MITNFGFGEEMLTYQRELKRKEEKKEVREIRVNKYSWGAGLWA